MTEFSSRIPPLPFILWSQIDQPSPIPCFKSSLVVESGYGGIRSNLSKMALCILRSNCLRTAWKWKCNYSSENLTSPVCLTSIAVLLSPKEKSHNTQGGFAKSTTSLAGLNFYGRVKREKKAPQSQEGSVDVILEKV